MTMHSICTAFVTDDTLDKMLSETSAAEKYFTRDNGVLSRRFFQCRTQRQVIWANTEWDTEDAHNDAAQSIMKTRRDDRISSVIFGPEPYFEIFAEELKDFRVGAMSDAINLVVVGHGLIAESARETYLERRSSRWQETGPGDISWLRLYHNSHHQDEFVFFMGFESGMDIEKQAESSGPLIEHIFTGLDDPFAMAPLAGYNQFVCVPLDISNAKSAVN